MDRIMRTLSEQAAVRSSRGGFLAKLGMIALGGAAALAGGSSALTLGGLGVALASCASCCAGCQSQCSTNSCPANTCLYDGGSCCTGVCGTKYQHCFACLDCSSAALVCAYSTTTSTNCPCGPNHSGA